MAYEMQRIVILDSGFGGLSVAAPVIRALAQRSGHGVEEVFFYDALPAPGRGYDSLTTLEEKAACFSTVMSSMEQALRPTLIVIACNTLSVLVNQTPFFQNFTGRVCEITQPAIQAILKQHHLYPDRPVSLFGTKTTIQSQLYPRALVAAGMPENIIQAIPCEHLPKVLESEDLSGEGHALVQNWIARAAAKRGNGTTGLSVLACTHFGLNLPGVKHQFALSPLHRDSLLNPNDALVESVLNILPENREARAGPPLKVSYARYCARQIPLLPAAVEAYLEQTSPELIDALRALPLP